MIHRLNVFLLSLIISFAPSYVFAVQWPDDKPRNWQYYEMLREEKRLQVHLKKQINNLGSSKTIEAVVETTPTASKVGGVMMKRIKAVAGSPGGAMIGSIAVMELIEAIGWVMEDGSYIKKLPKNPDDVPAKFSCTFDNHSLSLNQALQTCTPSNWTQVKLTPKGQDNLTKDLNALLPGATKSSSYEISVVNTNNSSSTPVITSYALNYKKEMPKTEDEKHILTPTMLGAAMLGSGYVDPDPKFNNDSVNNDRWTGVGASYTHEPSGVGNELADALDDKAERAKPTSDGKPGPIGDPRYNKPLDSNDDANDRQWGGEEGTEGETESTVKEDPETGDKVQQGTFKLPKFCDWAMTVCDWYEGWKKTDVKVNQHIDDTKQHQIEEKSFWQSVKDWFDWTKEDDLPEKDESDLKVETPLELQNYSVSWNEQCPESQTVNVGFHGVTKEITIINWAFVCSMDYIIKPAVIAFASLSGLYIILGTHRRESD